MAANPERATPFADLVPELLELARGDYGPQLTREIDHVDDEQVGDIPIRIYRDDSEPTGLVVYFHGGGHVIGSIGIMDGVAREIAHASGAVVVSVGYRLAPEDPYPAAVDDCTTVTAWALSECGRFGLPPSAVAVAGESAGGNMAAPVALRLRDAGGATPVGQVLIYPALAGSKALPSREEFSGLVISLEAGEAYWEAYSGGRDLDDDPYAAPLFAVSLAGVPPALVILGGCDMLRDEGRAYAERLRTDGVDVEEICYPGQPHGFVNFGFPAAAPAFERTGAWLRCIFERARADG
jgi:acetyl esterase